MKASRKDIKAELQTMADRLHALKMTYTANVDATPQTERQFEVVRQAVRDLLNAV